MKVQCLAVVAVVALAGASCAQARQVDPGGKIEVACAQTNAVRMATIGRAVENSHYWASQATRKEMLALARQACERGATVVTFVPPPDQRFAPEDAEVADTAPRIDRAGT